MVRGGADSGTRGDWMGLWTGSSLDEVRSADTFLCMEFKREGELYLMPGSNAWNPLVDSRLDAWSMVDAFLEELVGSALGREKPSLGRFHWESWGESWPMLVKRASDPETWRRMPLDGPFFFRGSLSNELRPGSTEERRGFGEVWVRSASDLARRCSGDGDSDERSDSKCP